MVVAAVGALIVVLVFDLDFRKFEFLVYAVRVLISECRVARGFVVGGVFGGRILDGGLDCPPFGKGFVAALGRALAKSVRALAKGVRVINLIAIGVRQIFGSFVWIVLFQAALVKRIHTL